MAQYVYTMRRVGKVVPPKRVILKDISLNSFIASNDHAIGTPCCALLPLWRAANETEDVGAVAHQGAHIARTIRARARSTGA